MTLCLSIMATLVAIAAAARSTWSPCGLSMLSSITPVSERAKGNSYRSTAAWFVLGSTLGGATLGTAMAATAAATHRLGLPPTGTGVVAVAAALVAAGSDAGVFGLRVPIHRRQVNERWLDRYRPWVYGAGFGWQIGSGLTTYITTAAVYLMVVLGALTVNPAVALGVGTGFGILRGLAVLLTRRLTAPTELRTFHRRFDQAGPAMNRLVIAVESGTAVVVALYLRSPIALAVVGIAFGVSFASLISAKVPGRAPSRAGVVRATAPSTASTQASRGPTRHQPNSTLGLVDHGRSPASAE
ncbi:MAG TPA: hypothetical protein VND67_02745 [Acidimicrobiales bacterium]|nr:hypothetical protein [Acidimicrobiales bacterium]